jgi:molecular chaperone IbpA
MNRSELHAFSAPLFRSAVGFDRVFKTVEALATAAAETYPPFDIERVGDDGYRITMAVAGFTEEDISISVKERTLTVSAKAVEREPEARFTHRGIARRSFERRFALAEYVEVVGASLANGLLSVDLERRLPESAKPRTIQIATSATRAIQAGQA